MALNSTQTSVRQERNKQPETQQDFYTWLRRLPIGFLHEIYRRSIRDGQQLPTEQVSSTLPEVPVGEFTKQTAKEGIKTKIILRKSVFVLISTLVSIEILFDLIYVAFRIPFFYMQFPQILQLNVAALSFLVFVALNLIKIGFMVHAALKWLTFFYEIRTGEVRKVSGIINHNEKIFLSSYAQEVIHTQDLLGRVFNYGTIEIYNPTIKDKLYLESIPNPKKYVEVIKESIPSPEQIAYMPMEMHST